LQLRAEGLSGRAIAASQGMSRNSITALLEAADAAGGLGRYCRQLRRRRVCPVVPGAR
jgi:hypothetical protein